MGIIKQIIDDYEDLIKKQIIIPLDNGDIIKFAFDSQDLPHLLGLYYLVDIPVLFEYKNGRVSASELYRGMCNGTIDIEEFEKSLYFEEVYNNRIKYFNSNMIMDIIKSKQIVKFDSSKIKEFSTKLVKVEYMFWKFIKDENNNYGCFGIGFTASEKATDINYPNTFFFRENNQYIYNQVPVLPLSLMLRDKRKEVDFEIYWDKIRESMCKNIHYKWLAANSEVILRADKQFDEKSLKQNNDDEVKKHYRLMRLDEMNKAYLPHMDDDFRWSNLEKDYIMMKSEKMKKTYLPNEVKMLINEFRQIGIDVLPQ